MKADHLRTFDVSAYSSEVTPLASTMLDRWALARIQSTARSAPIRFMLWDGFEWPSTAGPAVATILFKNRPALLGWVWDPELNFGEAYMSGAVEVRGDLLKTLEEIYRALGTSTRRPWFFSFRGLVVANPLWYPTLAQGVRTKLLNFVRAVLASPRFEPSRVNEYCSG